MTHDELLEAVNSPTYRQSRTLEHPYIALRAVLELHKPFDITVNDKNFTFCDCGQDYPCPIIQAIEKELG